MMVPPPFLPVFRHFPFYTAIDGLTGYVAGTIGQVNPNLMATIFIVRSLGHTLLYEAANLALKGKDLQSQKIYLVTSSATHFVFFLALRKFNLIGHFFSCLLGLAYIGHLIHRVRYIQHEEKLLMKRT